jgi:hypothetical protein
LEKPGFVAIDGVIERFTAVGVFMDVEGRRVFLPDSCIVRSDFWLLAPRFHVDDAGITTDAARRGARHDRRG